MIRNPQLTVYLATASAVGFVADQAAAEIVYTPLGPTAGLLDSAGDVISIDFDGDGQREVGLEYGDGLGDPTADGNSGPQLNIKIFDATDNTPATIDQMLTDPNEPFTNGFGGNAYNVQLGTLIDATAPTSPDPLAYVNIGENTNGDTLIPGVAADNGGFFQVTDGVTPEYIGIRTQIDGNTHFGWIGVVITEAADPGPGPDGDVLSGYVSGYAYNNVPNAGIVAGVVPEPSGALLALGAAGLAIFRRKG